MLRRASESEAQRLQRLSARQQREADRRASESEAQRLQRLNAGQQREADRRASESEAQRLQRLTAAQQYKANRRASESEAEHSQRLAANQQREASRRASESEAEHSQRLAANQQREASRRASESEAEHSQRLAANQQREASRRASESEVEHAQRLADGQQRDANHRASESETQRQHRLSGNRERIATYRANATVEERQQRRENDRIIATRRRSAARQSIYDLQREAVKEFRQNIYTGPFNPCYCCTRLCYNNGGSFVDPNNSLLLPVHDRELSNVEPNISNSVWICSRCKSSLKKHKLPPFASVNNMRVPPVPSQLSCLNSMERRLISLIQPFMKLIVLPYGQRALQGQTVNFPVNTSEVCSSLPRTLDNAGIVLIAPPRTGSSDSTETPVPQSYFSVRRPYVIRALQWLRQHNSLYRDIEIEEVSDDALSSQSPVNEVELDAEGESSVIRRDLQLPNVEVSNLINSNAPVHQLQRVQGAPISIYTCTNAEQMAFPWLYPDGTNGYKTSRDPPITTLDYFQSRHLSSDARWASHIPYLFWSVNVLEQRRLNENISVAIRMRSCSGNTRTSSRSVRRQSSDDASREEQQLTAGDLRDMSNNPELSDSCYGFMHNMRGTIAYWQRAKMDLLAMFRTLGPPTFFITLTADDMNWPDLLYVLAKRAGMDISMEDVDSMSSVQKRELLCSDPVTTARHFSQRFQKFIAFMKSSSKPIGEIVDYFWRVEFQLRGSPHVHSLWWVKEAPDLQTVEGLRAVPGFIDQYITTKIPTEGEDDELRALVMRLQRHKHTHTCQKNGRRGCRFDYPKQPSPETRLKTNADGGNKARFYVIKREPAAEMVNPYNEHLLRAWRANMDVQVVGSVYGAALYVTHYICKDESQALKQVIAERLASLQQDATVKQRLRKIGNTLLSHRQLSQQEAAFLVAGLHLKGSSRATVFVAAIPKRQRTRLVRPSNQLRELDNGDTNVFMHGLFDRYTARPTGAPFDDMTLAHFAVWYKTVSGGEDDETEVTSGRLPRFQLQNGMGTIAQRSHQACLRVPVMTPESHGDNYYYHLLMLYLPWRQETEDLLGEYDTAQEALLAKKDQLQFLNSEHGSFADEVQQAIQQLSNLQNTYGDNLYAPVAPNAVQETLDAVAPESEFDPLFDGDVNIEEGALEINDNANHQETTVQENGDLQAALFDDTDNNILSRRRMTDAEYNNKVAGLNDSQRDAFDRVVQYNRARHQYYMRERESLPEPLHVFITGGAGTGKSHLISVIKEHIERSHTGCQNACMLVAPTGVAAFNIGGLTIHYAFRLPVEHGNLTRYTKLSAERLHQLRLLCKDVHTIIIDEISMVSYETLGFIHQRLTEIKGTDDTEVYFGGLNIIAVGDFYQLPPVRDRFVFQNGRGYVPASTHLWRDLFTMVELHTNMRQRNDTTYSEVLNRIRTGDHTSDDVKLLRTRLTSGIINPVQLRDAKFSSALYLLPRKEQVEEYNTQRLLELAQTTPVYEFNAEHVILESRYLPHGVTSRDVPERLIPKNDNNCAGLPHTLKLAVGAQVMLRRNIMCEDGLVNGARGVIVGFKWLDGADHQAQPGLLPSAVLVKFHDPRVGRIHSIPVPGCDSEAVEIRPISAKFFAQLGVTLQRTQLPLVPCWAATIHKVQGLSLDAAVIDLGPSMFEDGMAYVALSRVRTLDGVALLDLVASKIKASALVQQEMARLRSLPTGQQ